MEAHELCIIKFKLCYGFLSMSLLNMVDFMDIVKRSTMQLLVLGGGVAKSKFYEWIIGCKNKNLYYQVRQLDSCQFDFARLCYAFSQLRTLHHRQEVMKSVSSTSGEITETQLAYQNSVVHQTIYLHTCRPPKLGPVACYIKVWDVRWMKQSFMI